MYDATGPMTGDDYLASIADDGREVWLRGERVGDITKHHGFRNSARMIARLYDALHDPAKSDCLTIPMDDGSGIRTHRFFQAPHSVEEQVAARDAVAEWARITYGWMGRSPDFKAAWLGLIAGNSDLCGEFAPNARRWYGAARRGTPFMGHAYVNPPVDRHLHPDASDVIVRVEKETDAGLVVSGAKVVATQGALCNHIFVGHYNVVVREKRFSPVFIAPMNTPGVKMICRNSYEYAAAKISTPFDAPLSSRLDENDSILIFDNALIPWENVIMYGVDMANQFISQPGFLGRNLLHGCTRLAVKLEFIAGVMMRAVELIGSKETRSVQAAVGEVIGLRHLMWSLSDAMAYSAEPWVDDLVLPNTAAGLAYRMLAPDVYSRVRNLVNKTVSSALVYLPSLAADLANPEELKYLDRYVRGAHGEGAMERVKVMKLMWDAVGSEFGARHELYEINYAGNHEQIRVDPLVFGEAFGGFPAMHDMVDRCLAEYDLNGWIAPDLINP